VVLDTLGYSLLKNGRGKEARKVLEKASALLSKNPTISYHLALADYAAGDSKKAIARMQNTLKMGSFPESAQARSQLALWTGQRGGK